MRILFCNYEYPPLGGGGGVINALLAQEMAKHHEVTVLTSQGLGLSRERVENGVRVIRVPVFFRKQQAVANLHSMFAYILMGIKVGKKLVETNQYDIINTQFVLPTGPVGDALSHFGGIPNVLTLLGGDVYDPSKFFSPHRHPLLRAWVRSLLKRADVVVGDSRDTLENMHHYYSPGIEGTWIPLGIQRPNVEFASRRRYGCREDEVLLVTVGRLIARKGLDQLMAMMEIFKGQKVRLFVMGTGPQENLLKEEALKRQVSAQVHFMGYVEEAEKFRILQMCDLYVSTSQHEGFGLVFLEAMACGLPIVCYDHGGQTDFLQDRKTGYLVPLNDLGFFQERCQLLIRNPGLRKTISKNNKRQVETFYIENCAAKYEKTFHKALEIGVSKQRARFFQKRTTP